jgi:hypothetical protein
MRKTVDRCCDEEEEPNGKPSKSVGNGEKEPGSHFC